jgi:hypothetical protein
MKSFLDIFTRFKNSQLKMTYIGKDKKCSFMFGTPVHVHTVIWLGGHMSLDLEKCFSFTDIFCLKITKLVHEYQCSRNTDEYK